MVKLTEFRESIDVFSRLSAITIWLTIDCANSNRRRIVHRAICHSSVDFGINQVLSTNVFGAIGVCAYL